MLAEGGIITKAEPPMLQICLVTFGFACGLLQPTFANPPDVYYENHNRAVIVGI